MVSEYIVICVSKIKLIKGARKKKTLMTMKCEHLKETNKIMS